MDEPFIWPYKMVAHRSGLMECSGGLGIVIALMTCTIAISNVR